MRRPVDLGDVNKTSQLEFTALLGEIFEHAPWVAEKAFQSRPFATVEALHDSMMAAIRALPQQEQIAFVRLHPDLAGKAARAGQIEPESVAEQAGLGLDRLSDEDYERFERLNEDYRQRFGFPFVACVRRLTRDAVLDQFEARLTNSPEAELAAALTEIGYITRLRLVDRVKGPGMPQVAGRLSTHVLDTHKGAAAGNVRVQLYEVGRMARALLLETATNADGRTDKPLLSEAPLRIGTYELVFHVGPYFAERGLALPARPFLDLVPLRFGIADPEGHYHVPLVMTPWSYATYRGS